MEPSTTNNPFDRQKQEAMYLAYEHGFNSVEKEENPYIDMPEMASAMSAWNQGYNANKKRAKRIKPSPLSPEEMLPLDTEEHIINNHSTFKDTNPLNVLTDEFLITELKRRKQGELHRLLMQKEDIDRKVTKLKALMEL